VCQRSHLARGNVPLLLAKKAPAAVIALCTDAAVLCSKDAMTAATPGTSLSNCSADLARGNVPLFTLRADTAAAPLLPARNAPAAIALCTTDAAAACMNLTCALLCPRTGRYRNEMKIEKEKDRKIKEIIRKIKIKYKVLWGETRVATDAQKSNP